MKAVNQSTIILLSIIAATSNAFFTPSQRPRPMQSQVHQQKPLSRSRSSTPTLTLTVLQMGIFDDLKLIFSEEGKANRAAYEEREKEEQEKALQEIRERRNNPEKMQQYEEEVKKRRSDLNEERSVWDFQNKNTGEDPLKEWNKLREEGKIQVGTEMERDASSSRLGSEGLVEVRTDERLPYIDQGYVDEDADVMGNFMKMFGGGKKDDKKKD